VRPPDLLPIPEVRGNGPLLGNQKAHEQLIANLQIETPSFSGILPLALTSAAVVIIGTSILSACDRPDPVHELLCCNPLRLRKLRLDALRERSQVESLSDHRNDEPYNFAHALGHRVLPRCLVQQIVVEIKCSRSGVHLLREVRWIWHHMGAFCNLDDCRCRQWRYAHGIKELLQIEVVGPLQPWPVEQRARSTCETIHLCGRAAAP